MARIGYELDLVLTTPPEYWAYRLKAGRRTSTFGPFTTERRARQEIDFQMSLDKDDLERSRVVTPERVSTQTRASTGSSTTPNTSTEPTDSE